MMATVKATMMEWLLPGGFHLVGDDNSNGKSNNGKSDSKDNMYDDDCCLVEKFEVRRASPDQPFLCVENQNLLNQQQFVWILGLIFVVVLDQILLLFPKKFNYEIGDRAKYKAEEDVCGPRVPTQKPVRVVFCTISLG